MSRVNNLHASRSRPSTCDLLVNLPLSTATRLQRASLCTVAPIRCQYLGAKVVAQYRCREPAERYRRNHSVNFWSYKGVIANDGHYGSTRETAIAQIIIIMRERRKLQRQENDKMQLYRLQLARCITCSCRQIVAVMPAWMMT